MTTGQFNTFIPSVAAEVKLDAGWQTMVAVNLEASPVLDDIFRSGLAQDFERSIGFEVASMARNMAQNDERPARRQRHRLGQAVLTGIEEQEEQ